MLLGKNLIIADLHLGVTRELYEKGISIPSQVKPLIEKINKLKKMTKARNLVILGDIKHKIPGISWQEMKEVPEFLSQLRFEKIILIKGNHDGNIERLIPKKEKIKIRKSLVIGDYLLTHGHRKIKSKSKTIVIGHNQPHIKFRDKFGATYVEPVWIRGPINGKKLIIMPAFNELCGATIVNLQPLIGPIAKKLKRRRAHAFLLDGTDLGVLDNLKIE